MPFSLSLSFGSHTQNRKIHPQRIHLAIKRSKRCRTCRHILIKPEQKAQATRFKIKLVAMNYIPNITLIPKKNWPLQVNVPTQILLKFTNPLYEEMHITLATPLLKENASGRVTILSPHFTVGAYNETMEYDDEMYPRRNNNHLSVNNNFMNIDGVYEKRNNYTSIIIEVVPEEKGEFKASGYR